MANCCQVNNSVQQCKPLIAYLNNRVHVGVQLFSLEHAPKAEINAVIDTTIIISTNEKSDFYIFNY